MSTPRIVRNVGRPTLAQEAIAKYLVRKSIEIQEDQIDKNLVASGDSLKSHVVTINKKDISLKAASYYPFLIEGRGPGKMPPIDRIVDWVKDKRLSLRNFTTGRFITQSESNIRSAAFVIARKIGREGTAIFRGDREGIDLLEIATKDEGVLYKQVGKAIADQVTDSILAAFTKNPNFTVK